MGMKDNFRKAMAAVMGRQKAQDYSYEESAAARIAELTASRRTIAEAFEIERRRIENDLHDGAQQYIVAASMKLGLAELEAADINNEELLRLLAETRQHLDDGLRALRRTVHGIHPQVLRDRGLQEAVEEIAEGYGPHVVVHTPYPLPELNESVLASAYFFCAEVLTNAAKYAPNAPVSVLLTSDQTLNISITDQGLGGAVLGRGLKGMKERLAAFDGEMTLHSPVGGPTQVVARIPLLLNRGESGIGD
ncbi:MAG: histidine kinase [Corynebacterium sp.]|uniref:sensor histidine kinase n=1 Tax=Corynebacterium sp. TaxID=1720 RepID=UPI0026DC8C34|nr:histidine kinase [Corynebacterium sp.]MDO5029746.1 histidine kinase [Corynebacterium sp.]